MPRQRKGTLVLKANGYYAKYWKVVDGVETRVTEFLHTKNRVLAEKKLLELVEIEAGIRKAAELETFRDAAARIQGERAKNRVASESEQGYVRKWVTPAIGDMLVTHVTKEDIVAILEKARDVGGRKRAGSAQETILKIRNACHHIFAKLVKEGAIKSNPVPAADDIPEALPETFDDRPKAVLTDDELLHYLAYNEPREGEFFLGALRERQLMALLSRSVGGMRTGEVQGITWSRARAPETFEAIEVIRFKTRRKAGQQGSKAVARQLYPLGDTVLPFFLRFWYLRTTKMAGKEPDPDSVLFPVRLGERVGEKRSESYMAEALRRDIKRAFGLEVWSDDKVEMLAPVERVRQILQLRNAGASQKQIAARLSVHVRTVKRVLDENRHLLVTAETTSTRVLGLLADHAGSISRVQVANKLGMAARGAHFENLCSELARLKLVEWPPGQGASTRPARITAAGLAKVRAAREEAAARRAALESADFCPRGVAAAGKWAPGKPSAWTRRLRELLEGTDDRKRLWFHNSRNAAAIASERYQRLKQASEFTAHATAAMLQLYRARAGEVDVVPMAPELMPDGERLCAILRTWCEVDGIDPVAVFGPKAEPAPGGPDGGEKAGAPAEPSAVANELAAVLQGDVTLTGVRKALDRALADGDVELARQLNVVAAAMESGAAAPSLPPPARKLRMVRS